MLKLKKILDSDASDVINEQMMKDIQLDLVQAPSLAQPSQEEELSDSSSFTV